jgi:histidine triad (HIT) family protein
MAAMATDCIFCKIAAGDIPVTPVLKTELVTVFPDIQPQAPTHLLVIPNTHTASLNETDTPELLGALLMAVRQVTAQLGLHDYRTVINTGAGAGQSVFHLHVHVLAGRPLAWPPG